MSLFLKQLSLEFFLFLKQKTLFFVLLTYFLLGCISVFFGSQHYQKRLNIQKDSHQFYVQQIEHLQHQYAQGEHAGYWCYYSFFPVVDPPSTLSSLSQGLSHLLPEALPIRLLGLELQRYDTSIYNPFLESLGTLDLSTIILFLAPIWLILASFNIISRDHDQQRLTLIRSQGISLTQLLSIRLFIRFGLIFVTTVLLWLIATLTLKSFNRDWICWLLTFFLYLVTWTLLLAIIIQKFTSQKSCLLTCFLLYFSFNFLLPSSINLAVAHFSPISNWQLIALNQRQAVHEKWDMQKKTVLEPFLAKYPQFTPYAPKDENFHWGWYYAMHELGDLSVKPQIDELKISLLKRQQALNILSFFSPCMLTQIASCHYAQSDLANFNQFYQHLEQFHQNIRSHFLPLAFQEKILFPNDTAFFPTSPTLQKSSSSLFHTSVFFLLLFCFLLLLINFRLTPYYEHQT
jgi:ABC-2 type transport system permease protein